METAYYLINVQIVERAVLFLFYLMLENQTFSEDSHFGFYCCVACHLNTQAISNNFVYACKKIQKSEKY